MTDWSWMTPGTRCICVRDRDWTCYPASGPRFMREYEIRIAPESHLLYCRPIVRLAGVPGVWCVEGPLGEPNFMPLVDTREDAAQQIDLKNLVRQRARLNP